ncbi:uncharacterized protein PFL1_02680 [Pseudozyma flocculosa PF-1]|uniref:Uncharacterized protein n=2 Tax=Pseudozyma flocculosa TaxID=84751 RepID=A0A5C3F1I7_9BASI|nr:uncharacterized protein PFL1_02680 [Pseudozyma flocculosa PF-1]EPQ30007.1 hypothetical protein PFL1_02680 [Pseudozyma flocculosa PF-1]SPO37329.1 uncharacterized protein PSFLO_02802 [Pseudozyma flocculosa]
MSYRALHERFDLPAPPPRSEWSINRPLESDRAWLPASLLDSSAPVADLDAFLNNLFHPHLGRSVYIQCKVLSAILACLVLVLTLIIARRFHDRALWLFRLSQRSNGNLVVPNSITNLCVILLFYACILIAFDWMCVGWGENKVAPDHLFLWTTLIWTPLALGAYLAMLGVAMARPDALKSISPQYNRPPSMALRLGITPRVVNLAFLAAPLAHLAAIAVPIYLSDRHWQHALGLYRAWSQHYVTAGTAGSLDRETLVEAQRIWYEVLESCKWVCVAYSIWSVTGFVLGVAELLAGGSLALLVRRQIKTLNSFNQTHSFSESFAAQQRGRQLEQQVMQAVRDGAAAVDGTDGGMVATAALTDKSTAPSSVGGRRQRVGSSTPASTSIWTLHRRWFKPSSASSVHDTDSEDLSDQMASQYFTTAQLEARDTPAPTFFPAVKPSTFRRPPRATAHSGRRAQRRYLQGFFADIMVQFIGITIGCAVYAGLGVAMAMQWYAAWEGNNGQFVLSQGVLWSSYGAVVCGGGIFSCIFSRTYEPVLSSMAANGTGVLRPRIRTTTQSGNALDGGSSHGGLDSALDVGGEGVSQQQPPSARKTTLAWAASAFQRHHNNAPEMKQGSRGGILAMRPVGPAAATAAAGGGMSKQDEVDGSSETDSVLDDPFLSARRTFRRPSNRTLASDTDMGDGDGDYYDEKLLDTQHHLRSNMDRRGGSKNQDAAPAALDADGAATAAPGRGMRGVTIEETVTRRYERTDTDPVMGAIEVFHRAEHDDEDYGGAGLGSPSDAATLTPSTPWTPWTPDTPFTPGSTSHLLGSGKGGGCKSIASNLQVNRSVSSLTSVVDPAIALPVAPAVAITAPEPPRDADPRRIVPAGIGSGGNGGGGGELVGLGIDELQQHQQQSWTPPVAWESPEVDPHLVAEQASRQVRARAQRSQSYKRDPPGAPGPHAR